MPSISKHLKLKGNRILQKKEHLKAAVFVVVFLFLLLILASTSSLAENGNLLQIKDLKKVEKEAREEFRSQVSQRNLLGLKREHKFALPSLDAKYPQAETLRVLGIRVEFQQEVPDDPLTTGNGLFDRRSYDDFYSQEQHYIDPAPHLRQYFLAHLKALNNYWYTVSKGKLVLDYEVYPLNEDSTYQLPHTISYYGSTDSAYYPFEGLRKFFHDSFHTADSISPDIDFSDYDAFIVFHAGSDRQSDLGDFSPTYSPNDLFTGFIIPGDPVPVDGGSYEITEGLIIPETKSQDTRIAALNGVLAHEFGHQLGLLDFYNTNTFTTQIGDFSLMDNNAANYGIELEGCRSVVTGLLPVYPEAWSKAYLGFIQPVEILNQNGIGLFASGMLTDSLQTVKIPINSEEYFLLENRQMNIDDNLDSPFLLADSATGVVLGPVDSSKEINREYDILLPGSGILIWHIDEGVAYLDYDGNGFTNFEDNSLQWDKDRRFITLEEADGYIDFGGNYYTGYGLQEDMYYLGNNSNFTPNTFPSSRSNNRSETHIYVTNIGRSGVVMSFNLRNDIILAGWPQRIIADSGNSSLVYGDLDGDGKDEILTASGKYIFAWKTDGSKYIPNSDVIQVLGLDGKYSYYPLAIFSEADTNIFGTPSLGDLNGDDTLEVVAGDLNGMVYIWRAVDNNSDGRADLLGQVEVGNRISMTPVIAELEPTYPGPEIFAGAENGVWKIIAFLGSVIPPPQQGDYNESIIGLATTDIDSINFILTENSQSGHLRKTNGMQSWDREIPSTGNFPPVAGDLDRDGKLDVVVLSGNGEIYAWDMDGNVLTGFPVFVGDIKSAPVLGDIDGDGYLEIIFCGENNLYAYNYNGTPATDFQVTIDRTESVGSIYSAPVLADLDGDGKTEILFGLKDGRIYAFKDDGQRYPLFPLTLDGEIVTSGIVVNDSVNEINGMIAHLWRDIFFKTNDGLVYGFSLDFEIWSGEEKTPWLMYGYNAGHTNSLPLELLPSIPAYAELMPERSVYNYPNPARDETTIRYSLSRDAAVDIKIYDLSGDLVAQANQAGKANTENEYKWDCSGYASGVYLCRVEAKSDMGKKVAFCKIALVK